MRGIATAIVAAAALAACAHSPDGIHAAYVSPELYGSWSCPAIADEQTRVASKLAEESKIQQKAHDGDVIGVALFGLPVGSWSDGDHSADISSLKGQSEALKEVAAKCGAQKTL